MPIGKETHDMNARWKTAMAMAVVSAVCALWSASPAVAQAPQAAAAEITVKIDGEYGPHAPFWLPTLPTDVSVDGYKIDRIIDYLHYFMLLLFVGWGIFFVYCLVKFRQRPGHKADPRPVKAKASKWAEIGVAVFEVFLLVGLSIPAWADVKSKFPTEEDNPQYVRVMAEQFAWNFHYPGPDGIFGKLAIKHIDLASNPMGIDPADPNGLDDIVSGELHIVAGRPVIAEISSKDVIHSFFLPVMRVKQDAIPGMRISVWFQPKANSAGNYEVACAQLCGNNHYSMKALMAIHDNQTQFDEWLQSEAPVIFDEDELD